MSTRIEKLKQLNHKPGVSNEDWDRVHSNLLALAEYVLTYCETYNLPLVITSIIRPRIPGVSVSDSHSEGRAFDISVRGWKKDDILSLVDTVNEIFTIGAISMKDGKEREAVYEDGIVAGKGAHLHFQVRKHAPVPVVPEIEVTSPNRSAA